jgi:hypothetical protein
LRLCLEFGGVAAREGKLNGKAQPFRISGGIAAKKIEMPKMNKH